jgi:hypothetical protein
MTQPIDHADRKMQKEVLAAMFDVTRNVSYSSHINRHFLWDVLAAGYCDPECSCDDYSSSEDKNPRSRRARK